MLPFPVPSLVEGTPPDRQAEVDALAALEQQAEETVHKSGDKQLPPQKLRPCDHLAKDSGTAPLAPVFQGIRRHVEVSCTVLHILGQGGSPPSVDKPFNPPRCNVVGGGEPTLGLHIARTAGSGPERHIAGTYGMPSAAIHEARESLVVLKEDSLQLAITVKSSKIREEGQRVHIECNLNQPDQVTNGDIPPFLNAVHVKVETPKLGGEPRHGGCFIALLPEGFNQL